MLSLPSINTSLRWFLEEPDPLNDALQFLSDSEKEGDNGPKATCGPSKDWKRFEGDKKLRQDYFVENSTYNLNDFKHCFRITRTSFDQIHREIVVQDRYFLQQPDCTGLLGLSAEQKLTSCFRLLAYGVAHDATNKFSQLADSTARKSLYRFVRAIIAMYEDGYLRAPNQSNLKHILYENS
ncbi:hypothetical protein MJO28_016125 [Puccinia striiformis f. sp. tritici]|uniref:Uncharacterized protein n=1 Tax=Puccinia striiformis f. sp. tritici TaxID=168172 RepID=A0ACC0DQN5_9BASI|nr:hypothetical protein MJO29_015266 [Puccinia striiformis f. sp. tritici]KAI7937226.1 hypothetical protein MJO28_016125 [Puccinia striiformis f. sp. tritici]